MNITQLLKSYETLYVSFEPNQEEDFRKRLRSLGFDVSEKLKSSPAKIHRDRIVSFITGFNEGMLYSTKLQFEILCPNCRRIKYEKLSPENIESAWYKKRMK